MEENFVKLKSKIRELAANPKFIHNKWFVEWHLDIVERISLDLCDIYTEADRNLVIGLVWTHDYMKIIDYEHEHEQATFLKLKGFLEDLGFETEYIKKLMDYIEIFESKLTLDLNQAPLEVKIVSSADGASHMVGLFHPLHWSEHPEKSIEQYIQSTIAKLEKDWDRKIVLPEVKKAFQEKYRFLMEMCTTNYPTLTDK